MESSPKKYTIALPQANAILTGRRQETDAASLLHQWGMPPGLETVCVGMAYGMTGEAWRQWEDLNARQRNANQAVFDIHDLEKKIVQDWTALHCATIQNHVELVRWLLSTNAVVDARADRSWTPMHAAARVGRAEVARWLLQGGAAVDPADVDAMTPLHWAAWGHAELLDVLLRAGADTSARDRHMKTPLHHAVEKAPVVGVAAALLEYGASPSDEDENGNTPLALARRRPPNLVSQELISLLERAQDAADVV